MNNLRELYEFRTGDTVYRFTNRTGDILHGGHAWSYSAIERSSIAQSPEAAQNSVELMFPLGHDFAMEFLGYGPEQQTSVTIYRNSLADDAVFLAVFKGFVADCEIQDDEIKLVCESIMLRAKNSGNRARMQKFCRHAIYDTSCKVNETEFAVSAVPTAVDAGYLSVTCTFGSYFAGGSEIPTIDPPPDGYFAGGMLKLPSGALRYIVAHVGNVITLWRPEPSIVEILNDEESELILYPGCDGSLNTCYTRFNNTENNGAFYWIPAVNPVGGPSVF